jgi:hypothetical protein
MAEGRGRNTAGDLADWLATQENRVVVPRGWLAGLPLEADTDSGKITFFLRFHDRSAREGARSTDINKES